MLKNIWFGIKTLKDNIGIFMHWLQTLPTICWLSLAMFWFGLTETTVIAIVFSIGLIVSVTTVVWNGIKNIPVLYLRVARTLGIKGYKLYSKVFLPAIFPYCITGIKRGWSSFWQLLVVSKLLYVSPALGQILMMGRELKDINQVVTAMTIIMSIGLLIDHLIFNRLEAIIYQKWGLILTCSNKVGGYKFLELSL